MLVGIGDRRSAFGIASTEQRNSVRCSALKRNLNTQEVDFCSSSISVPIMSGVEQGKFTNARHGLLRFHDMPLHVFISTLPRATFITVVNMAKCPIVPLRFLVCSGQSSCSRTHARPCTSYRSKLYACNVSYTFVLLPERVQSCGHAPQWHQVNPYH